MLRKRTFVQADTCQPESQHFGLQKPIAIVFPLAIGLRNGALPYDF